MTAPVGCLTEITFLTINHTRHTVEQDWYLHPTKGWKRGSKRKTAKPVTYFDSWPRSGFKETWKRY